MEVYIQKDHWTQQVKIFLYEYIGGSERTVIHSLDKDGMATCEQRQSCGDIPKPYLTIPDNEFEAIEKHLFGDNEKKLQDEIIKLKGEITAKERHIQNLNDIFEKTLNKIK